MEAVIDLHQLCGNAHLGSGLAHGALQDVLHPKGFADLAQILVLALEHEGRRAAGDPQVLYLRQRVQDFLRDAVRKVLLFGVGRHVDERQYGD